MKLLKIPSCIVANAEKPRTHYTEFMRLTNWLRELLEELHRYAIAGMLEMTCCLRTVKLVVYETVTASCFVVDKIES